MDKAWIIALLASIRLQLHLELLLVCAILVGYPISRVAPTSAHSSDHAQALILSVEATGNAAVQMTFRSAIVTLGLEAMRVAQASLAAPVLARLVQFATVKARVPTAARALVRPARYLLGVALAVIRRKVVWAMAGATVQSWEVSNAEPTAQAVSMQLSERAHSATPLSMASLSNWVACLDVP